MCNADNIHEMAPYNLDLATSFCRSTCVGTIAAASLGIIAIPIPALAYLRHAEKCASANK